MKKFLTIVAVATLSLTFGAISYAQDAGPTGGQVEAKQHHAGGGGGFKMIVKTQKDILATLHLTDDQKKQIETLNKSTEGQMKAMHKANKGAADQKANSDARRDMMKKYNDAIKGILKPDQFKTYHEQMKAKMKEYHAQHKKDSDKKPQG